VISDLVRCSISDRLVALYCIPDGNNLVAWSNQSGINERIPGHHGSTAGAIILHIKSRFDVVGAPNWARAKRRIISAPW
jgi:hypothetical protein